MLDSPTQRTPGICFTKSTLLSEREMSIEFKLPEVAEGVESADIAEVHVAEGDVIEAGQTVFEVETEKAVVDIECPHAGKVVKIHVSAGDSVPIGGTLLTIEESDGQAETKKEKPKSEETAQPKQEEKPSQTRKEPEKAPKEQPAAEKPASGKPAAAPSAQKQPAAARPSAEEGAPPPPAGPATRRLARELGVDLHLVRGSETGGRITAEDVKAFVRDLTSGVRPTGGGGAAAPALPDFSQFGPVERESLSKLARTSAGNLSTSWQVIPHVTQHELADITELETARKRFGASAPEGTPKVTMTAIMIKVAVGVLKEFPHFNSSLDPQTNELVVKQYYHIGVAVDTPAGLLVPVVRDVDRKSIVEVAEELTELAGKARERKLGMEQMQGASFTITNLGGIGGTAFTPIVNYPEVAILGMSRTQKQLQLVDGELVERLMLPLSLSYDHRVVNGADAARFIVRLSTMLSDSFQFLAYY